MRRRKIICIGILVSIYLCCILSCKNGKTVKPQSQIVGEWAYLQNDNVQEAYSFKNNEYRQLAKILDYTLEVRGTYVETKDEIILTPLEFYDPDNSQWIEVENLKLIKPNKNLTFKRTDQSKLVLIGTMQKRDEEIEFLAGTYWEEDTDKNESRE